jgi:hypothetical protein
MALGLGLGVVGLAAGVALAWQARADLPSAAALLRGPHFRLHAVDIVGLQRLEPAAVLARAGLEVGTPLIDLDPQAVADAVARHPRIASTRALRLPPDRLLLEVVERQPIAALADDREGIDAEGARFPLDATERAALPVVSGDPAWALPLLRAAREAGLALARVESRAPDDLSFRTESPQVRVRIGTNAAGAVADWGRLMAQGVLQEYAAREVDLRFQGQAVLRDFGNQPRGGEDGSQ